MKLNTLGKLPNCTACATWLFFLLIPLQTSWAQDQAGVLAGDQVFKTYCFACHGINEAQRVGPDLAAVHERRSTEWLVEFIKSPQAMFDSGDSDAVALFGEFNGLVMPNSAISDHPRIHRQSVRYEPSLFSSRSKPCGNGVKHRGWVPRSP